MKVKDYLYLKDVQSVEQKEKELQANLRKKKEILAELKQLTGNENVQASFDRLHELMAQFDAFEDEYLRERKQDVMQVGTRIMRALRERNRLVCDIPQAFDTEMILVAHDISPADMLQFKGRSLGGFITDTGGPSSGATVAAPPEPLAK